MTTHADRPQRTEINVANIDPKMKAENRWVLWKYEKRDGKWTKPPVSPKGVRIDVTNPKNRIPFEAALDAYNENPEIAGIGFVLGDGWLGIDFDGFEGGKIPLRILAFIQNLNSYAEWSPSGKGAHVITQGEVPGDRSRKDSEGVEIYDHARYFTVTGHIIQNYNQVQPAQQQIREFYNEIFQGGNEPKEEEVWDEEKRPKLAELLEGNWQDHYDSQSQADMAACNMLANLGMTAEEIHEAVAKSKLSRDKWFERRGAETYGWITAKRAVEERQDSIQAFLMSASTDHGGHADCVLKIYPNRFRYTETHGWLYNNGRYWQQDLAQLKVKELIDEVLRLRRITFAQSNQEWAQKKVSQCKSATHLIGSILAQLEWKAMSSIRAFDNSPHLLNVENGVVDLRTGRLQPRKADDRFLYCAPTPFDETADTSLWVDFLKEVLNINNVAGTTLEEEYAGLLEYFQKAVGYSVTGDTREEIMFYLYGPARSGKNTFTDTIIETLGNLPLSAEIDFSAFTDDGSGQSNQNFHLAPLKPARFVASSESGRYSKLKEEVIKRLSAANLVYCAFKYQTQFNYRPQFKIWLTSNFPPKVDVDDAAAWGRLKIIEFPNSHLGSEDKTLKKRLTQLENRMGVLRWIVEGAVKWYETYQQGEGLRDHAFVRKTTEAQRDQQNFVKMWLDEACEITGTSDYETFTLHSDLYESYKLWCREAGVKPKYKRSFTTALNALGIESSDNALRREDYRGRRKLGRGFYGVVLTEEAVELLKQQDLTFVG